MKMKPFKAMMPKKEYVAACAALPYDVMSSAEAKEVAKKNPLTMSTPMRAKLPLPPVPKKATPPTRVQFAGTVTQIQK